jgi:hypothetical protein
VCSRRISPIHMHEGSRGSVAYLREKPRNTFVSVEEGGTSVRESAVHGTLVLTVGCAKDGQRVVKQARGDIGLTFPYRVQG